MTVKYRHYTVSQYFDEIYCQRLLKLSIESFSFFLSPFTIKVLVQSEDKLGPQHLELDFDQLGLLESEGHVGVHAGSEVFHGLGIVDRESSETKKLREERGKGNLKKKKKKVTVFCFFLSSGTKLSF